MRIEIGRIRFADEVLICIAILGLLMAAACRPAFAQCNDTAQTVMAGGGGGGFLRGTTGGPASPFSVEPTRYPTHDSAQMAAMGFSQRVNETGGIQWVRPAPGTTNVTQSEWTKPAPGTDNVTYGASGQSATYSKDWEASSVARSGGNSSWPAAPRGDRPPVVDSSKPKPSPPSTPTSPTVDTDKLVNTLIEKLAADSRFRGPKGEDGKAGKDGRDGIDGKPGRDGKDAVVDQDVIVNAVLAKIDYNAIAAKIKPVIPITNTTSRHYVVIADKNAGYFSRLNGEINAAREYYAGIDLVDKPEFVTGPMPKIVVYEDATPIQTIEGLHEVSTLLASLSR